MESEQDVKAHAAAIRGLAEARLKKITLEREITTSEEAMNLLHELEVHQIELEMQNEELRTAHLALAESNQKYFNLFEFAPVGLITTDEHGRISHINMAACGFIGADKNEILGKPLTDLISREFQDRFYFFKKQLMEGKSPEPVELMLLKKSGGTFWADVGIIVTDINSKNPQLQISINDITARKSAEEELRLSERRYANLIDTMQEGLGVKDENDRITFMNRRGCEMLGYKPEELLGQSIYRVFDGKNRNIMQEQMKRRREGITHSYEIAWLRKDGTTVETIVTPSPIFDHDGKMTGSVAVFTDITDRKRAEAELRANEKKFRQIINVSPVPIALNDERQNITFLNPAFTQTFGYTLTDIPTLQDWWPQAYPDLEYRSWVADTWLARLEQARATGTEFVPMEVSIQCKDGTVKYAIVSATPMAESFEKEHLVLLYDITERKRAEELVEEKNRELIKASAEKDKFFSILSHDLKSPLHAFIGITELMDSDITEFSLSDLSRIAGNMHRSAKNLYKLLDNLLMWAQLHRGTLEFSPRKHSLQNLVSNSIENLNYNAVQKGITVLNEVTENDTVCADERMMDTILRNLISNAIKFTQRGGRVTVTSIMADDGMTHIEVRDTGVGISDDSLKKLFKLGEKVGSKGTEGEPSTGLGLLLCKEFVDKHGGRIWVESSENSGSTVHCAIASFMAPAKE